MKCISCDVVPYIQLVNQKVTQNNLIKFSKLPPIISYQELYPSLPVPPEISDFKKNANLTEEEKKTKFDPSLMLGVFNLSYDNPTMTILNPINGERFMRQMKDNVSLHDLSYRYNVKVNNYTFYTVLYKYIKFLVATFARGKHDIGTQKESALSQLMGLAAEKSIGHIIDHIDYTLYARLLFMKLGKERITCETVFEKTKIGSKKIKQICGDNAFNLGTPESCEPWTSMNHHLVNSTGILLAKFSFSKDELKALFNTGLIGGIAYQLQKVKSEAAKYYQCTSTNECLANELAAIQWGSSGITRNVRNVYNSTLIDNTNTLQDWLLSSSLEPQEYYVFANKDPKDNIVIDKNAALEFIEKTFTSQFEALQFVNYTKDYKEMERKYNITHGKVLHEYVRNMIEKNLFGGPFINRTAREYAWGFYDQFLTSAVILSLNL